MSAKGTVGLLILTMVLGVLMDNIDASIVNVALPTIAADFHTDTSSVSWVSIAYSLMMAGLIIPFGRIADAGRIRVVFIAGFAVFTVFSVFCAMSTSLSLLVVSRIFQGIGAAAIVAVAPMICVKLLPREHLGRSLGIMAIASSTGFALGPALGGVLVQYLSWHWIFLINIPLGIACILLGRASLPREEVSKGALDVRGSVLLFVTVAAMVIAVESISDPDEMWIAVIAGIVAVLFLVGYIRESTHASRPLFDLSLFRLRDMDLALIAYLLLNLVYMGVLYVLPFYMDIELGLSSIMSGFILLLPSVLVIIMSIPVGNYTDHRGRRSCAIAASFFTLVYNVMFFLMEPEMGLLPLVVASLTMGTKGILHGFKTIMIQDEKGEPLPVYSIASGLDYPGSGPQHCYLHDIKRVTYTTITDREAVEAFYALSRMEGIIPALESSHAVAYAVKLAETLDKDQTILVNLSGRGDKDIDFVMQNYPLVEYEPDEDAVKENKYKEFLSHIQQVKK